MFGRTGNAKSNVTQASAWVTYALLAVGIVSPVVCVVWLVRTAVENENAVVRRLVAEANERRYEDAGELLFELTESLVPTPQNGGVSHLLDSVSAQVPEGESQRARAVLDEARERKATQDAHTFQGTLTAYLRDPDLRGLRLRQGRSLGALLIQLGLSQGGDALDSAFLAAADVYVLEHMEAGQLSRQHRYLLRQYAPLSGSAEVARLLERQARVERWIGEAEARGVYPPAAGLHSFAGFVAAREAGSSTVRIFTIEDWREAVAASTEWQELGMALASPAGLGSEGRTLPAPLDFVAIVPLTGIGEVMGDQQSKAVFYLWIGGIVLGLSILSGAAIVVSVRRQASVTQLKDNLVATVTHELKTPVSSIRLLVDTMLDPERREKVDTQEYIELISRENQRLGRLIDNFLSFSRMERSKGSFDIRATSPAGVLTAVEEAFRERFQGQAFDLSIKSSEALPDMAADPDALATVLGNLLENAFKYGGPKRRIELRCEAVAGGIQFEVQDFGKGISKRDQKRIFRKFFQVDHYASGQTGSVGLGLSIVEFIVSKHSGQIELESELGKGSVFKVRIPYA